MYKRRVGITFMQDVNKSEFEAAYPMYNADNLMYMDVYYEKDMESVYVWENHPCIELLRHNSFMFSNFEDCTPTHSVPNDSRRFHKLSVLALQTLCDGIITNVM